MHEIEVNEGSFEKEVLQSNVPVLIDFWAAWCGPCRMLAPVVAQIAEERAGSLKVAKVNVDENPGLAASFNVASIPMVALFSGGKMIESAVGYRKKEDLERALGLGSVR